MPSDQLRTNRHPTSTTPSLPHDSRTCHVLLRRAEWTRSKCRYRAPTWRNVAMSVETATDQCPWPRLRYRLLRGLRPCSQDLRGKKHAAPKCSRGSRERNDQSDPPVSPARLCWIHAAHDNRPTPCVGLLEPGSYRKDWAGPAERRDGRRFVPGVPPFPRRQSPQSFRPDAWSLPANNRELSREGVRSARNRL